MHPWETGELPALAMLCCAMLCHSCYTLLCCVVLSCPMLCCASMAGGASEGRPALPLRPFSPALCHGCACSCCSALALVGSLHGELPFQMCCRRHPGLANQRACAPLRLLSHPAVPCSAPPRAQSVSLMPMESTIPAGKRMALARAPPPRCQPASKQASAKVLCCHDHWCTAYAMFRLYVLQDCMHHQYCTYQVQHCWDRCPLHPVLLPDAVLLAWPPPAARPYLPASLQLQEGLQVLRAGQQVHPGQQVMLGTGPAWRMFHARHMRGVPQLCWLMARTAARHGTARHDTTRHDMTASSAHWLS